MYKLAQRRSVAIATSMSVIIVLVFLGGCMLPIYLIGALDSGPIDRAAKVRTWPRYALSMGDFLCLFIAVQLPLTLVSRFNYDDQDERYFWALHHPRLDCRPDDLARMRRDAFEGWRLERQTSTCCSWD